ncbi:hypothetical protein PHPALM_30742 [Phytophthora palmivora]|uniref:Gag protein n=1 Tax=Phytophthora palmivora TaxID=4796 RepID=A0A2P4X4E1_9STRA|nr:hypothetical protein PHPALM_30742 [Phytophthora palmivora]
MTAAALEGSTRPKPLILNVQSFEGKERENNMLWIKEVKMVMSSALSQTEHQLVALAISKLSGGARDWVLTNGSLFDGASPTWDELKRQLSRVFYARTMRIACVHATWLIASMFADPLPEVVTSTVFIDGLRTGVAHTEVFRSRPSSIEDAVAMALNAEHNFRSTRMDWSVPLASPPEGPVPTVLSYTGDEAADYRPPQAGLPVAQIAQVSIELKHRFNSEIRFVAKNDHSQQALVISQGGRGRQGLVPEGSIISQKNRICKRGLLVVEVTMKGFEKPWIASGNYVWGSSVEGSQLYAEALRARTSDVVTVRPATVTHVTVPKAPLG